MPTNLVWKRTTLPNGLTVITYPRQSANTAQVSVTVKSGSNHEPAEAAGITHFLEHMIAGGSEKRIQLSRSVEDCGGVLDFYTDHEQVSATLDVLPDKLFEASTVLSRLFFDDRFDEEKFKVERKIILNELAEYADDPTVKLEELLLENLFKKHPVKRPVGGYPKTVNKLSIQQLNFEHQTNYAPQNMILVLAGNALEKNLQRILNQFPIDCEKASDKKSHPRETLKPKNLVEQEKTGITQTYLDIGARTVDSNHNDAQALDLISTLLGGGTSSRLFAELREKNAVTYDVLAAHCKGTDYGYFGVNCAVPPRKLEKTKKLIYKEINKLRTDLVPVDELERAKQIMAGGILRGMDNPHITLELITYLEIQFKTGSALKDYLAKIKAVTPQEIREVAGRHLMSECLCTVVLKPKKI